MGTPGETRFRTFNPRRNLPAASGRKRGEANFLGAFIRALLQDGPIPIVHGRQFAVPNCGIADFVAVYSPVGPSNRPSSPVVELLAVEAKLVCWKRALHQAFRYRQYAHRSVVLVPPKVAEKAVVYTTVFNHLGIALWSFEKSSRTIRKPILPPLLPAMNSKRLRQALSRLGFDATDLGHFSELP